MREGMMKWIIAGIICAVCFGAGRFFYEYASDFWQPLIMYWAGIADMLLWAIVSERMR
jgi:TM2 domain-containing membrane protein YozV